MTHMTMWLHPTKAIVPIREFLLIQIYNLNSITFPETEELQCSIFRCIPAGGPAGGYQHLIQRANEVQFPNMEVWIPQSLKDFYWGLCRPLYCCVLKVPMQIRESALNSPAAALHRVLHSSALMPSAVATLSPVTSPLTPRRQVRTSKARLDNWPDPSPSIGVSTSLFFLIHFFLLFVHPKIAAPL